MDFVQNYELIDPRIALEKQMTAYAMIYEL